MYLKIQKGHTIEEYNKRYGKLLRKGRLLKIDPKNPAEANLISSKREYWEIVENGKAMIYEVPARRQIFTRFRTAKPLTKTLVTLTVCLAVGAAAAATTLHFLTPRLTEVTFVQAKRWIREHYKEAKTREVVQSVVHWDYSKNNGLNKQTPTVSPWSDIGLGEKDVNFFTREVLKEQYRDIRPSSKFDAPIAEDTVEGFPMPFKAKEFYNYTLSIETIEYFQRLISATDSGGFFTKENDFYITVVNTEPLEGPYYTVGNVKMSMNFHFDETGFLKEFTIHETSEDVKVTLDEEFGAETPTVYLGILDTTIVTTPSNII